MGMRAAIRIQECTMLLPSPTYATWGCMGRVSRYEQKTLRIVAALTLRPSCAAHLEIFKAAQVLPGCEHVCHDLQKKE